MVYQIYIFKFKARQTSRGQPCFDSTKKNIHRWNPNTNTGTYHSETCQEVQLHLLYRCAGEMSLNIKDDKCCFVIDFLQFELLSVTHTNSARPQDFGFVTETGINFSFLWNRDKTACPNTRTKSQEIYKRADKHKHICARGKATGSETSQAADKCRG